MQFRINQDILPFLGQQPENPLVLLGQYSDDELDEDSSVEQVQAVSGDTSVTVERQEKLDAARGNEDFCLEERNNPGARNAQDLEMENPLQFLESLKKTEVDCPTNNCGAESGVIPEETNLKEQDSASSFPQAVGDVILGWKVVFHEGSNRYYYWNTATDETSWEVPDILAQTSESADGKGDTADSGKEERVTGTLGQSAEVNGRNSCEPSMEVLKEECRGEMLDESTGLEQNQLKGSSPPNGTLNHATLPGSNVSVGKSNNEREDNVNGIESVVHETGGELAPSLVKCGEHLLEQLNSVTGSKCNMHEYNQILKYVSEIETRLADMKSLASCGSSLLPFWLHSQKQFQKLEIEVRDAVQSLESGQPREVGAEKESHENICNVSETNPIEKNAVCSSGDSGVPDSSETTKLQKNEMEVCSRGALSTEFVSSNGCLTTYTDFNLGGKAEVDGTVGHSEATPKSLLHCAEEMDMDIDMEVEDANPTVPDPSGAPHHIPLEESAAAREMFSVPPPPEEDWIPPPPPDTEPFPPPPPDEPPEILYSQASDVGSVQSFSYAEQYMSYNGPIYGYYAQANTDLPSSNLYVSAEASQPTLSHPALYFEPMPNGYPSTLATVNPVEPSVYYTLQDQHPMQSSVSHSSTVPKTISEATGLLHTHVEVESVSLRKEVNVPAVDGDAKKASFEIQSSQAFHQDLTTSVADSVTAPSIPDATAPVAPTITKAQTKVMRNKKRSVTSVSSLRSNKKVSSLVDKWKAAKEELQGEEEEPRSALEILEKKKQREIEEWYAQQIASGEAKDNANFQPLGGDWRERVKRKRARLASEPSQATSDTVVEGNQQPDLEEVTRGLPNGWQAYWDDSSKQVYYGNSVTSETTWVRPTS